MKRPESMAMVDMVAERLGPLNCEVVFLGGAVLGLLITDPGAPSVRYTMDVDIVVEIGSRGEYYRLAERLRELGFREKVGKGEPICRWLIEGITVDIMPTGAEILGFTNRWYVDAFRHAEERLLPSGVSIRLVTAPYFLATKIEAFTGRSGGDYLASHDLEDIIALVDGRPELEREIGSSEPGVRSFLSNSILRFLDDTAFLEAIPGHLPPDTAGQGRLPLVLERLRRITALV
jgi:predicted nucleotidyltransferase